MRTYYECIPCFVRQTVEAVQRITESKDIRERIIREVLSAASKMDLSESPPQMGRYIHRLIRELTESSDPYQELKRKSNEHAMHLYPGLKALVDEGDDRVERAIRLAIAGNIMDYGINHDIGEHSVRDSIELALSQPIGKAVIENFKQSVEGARSILYLGDNAGEIVFDKLLIEELPKEKIVYVVRGGPVINDATLEDAQFAGLDKLVTVIDNGSDTPGTILSECSQELRNRFRQADVVISKGQGNFETLNDAAGHLFYMLRAKCSVVAKHIGCTQGSLVFAERNVNEPEVADKESSSCFRMS